MTDIDKLPPTNFFSKGMKFSLLFHTMLVLWMLAHWAAETYSNKKSDDEALKLRPKKAIRVDVVDLPSLKFNELNQVDLTKEVAPQTQTAKADERAVPTVNPTAMQLPKTEKSAEKKKDEPKNSAQKRLEEIQKNIRAEAKRQEILNKYKQGQKVASADTRPALGGNIISKGGSVQGDVANEADEFTATVQTHVRKFWQAPPWSVGQNYKVRVVVKIAPSGRVLSKFISRTSGRSEFDSSALEAVEAANPFPAPPELFKRIVMNEGIECGFPE